VATRYSLGIALVSAALVAGAHTDPPEKSISQIQGDGFDSPIQSQRVDTSGVVTADFQDAPRQGFFLQDPTGDGRADTSDGIFVAERGRPVRLGERIRLVGKVSEAYGLTALEGVESLSVLSTGNVLPPPVALDPPFDDRASARYFEALEGMRVAAPALRAVSGTDRFGELVSVREKLGVDRVFQDDPRGTGERIQVDDGGGVLLSVKSGDRVLDLRGALDFTFGEYKVLPSPDDRPRVEEVPEPPLPLPPQGPGFSIATFNLENLFDTLDDPGTNDTLVSREELDSKLSKLAHALHDFLGEPTLVAVQEVERLELLEALAARPEIRARYGAVLREGLDPRGIDVGLLYRVDRVNVAAVSQPQGCTALADGLGPDADAKTCDSNGDGVLDGNRLFSRPPLVVELRVDGQPLTLILSHFKSKTEDTPTRKVTEARRNAQADFVAGLVQELLREDSSRRVAVSGDLNAFESEPPLASLEKAGLANLVRDLPRSQRYTFIFRGVSQVLDHILTSPALAPAFRAVDAFHFNVDYPDPRYGKDAASGRRSSDHDPLVAYFEWR